MISIGANIYLYWGLIVKDVRKITTDEVREAYRGLLIQTGERTYELIDEETAGTEFDLWLVTERKRVAQMAIEKERKRIIAKLDNYNMYRFEKEWMIELIEGE